MLAPSKHQSSTRGAAPKRTSSVPSLLDRLISRTTMTVALWVVITSPSAVSASSIFAIPNELVVAGWDEELVRSLNSVHCVLPESYSDKELAWLRRFNCMEKVPQAVAAFQNEIASGTVGSAQEATWTRKAQIAAFLCNQSSTAAGNYTAAWLAVNAWGKGIMNDGECCNMVHAPYCKSTQRFLSMGALCVLVGLAILMFAGTTLASCCTRSARKDRKHVKGVAALSFGAQDVQQHCDVNLSHELKQRWLQSHCLRVLPAAQEFASMSAEIFAALRNKFDFQADSVRNQHEHLLSLWRSHCATVADRSVQEGAAVDEEALLAEALGDLHAELLEGFQAWRSKLCKSDVATTGAQASGAMNSDTADLEEGATVADVAEWRTQLGEVAVFLLVWGEAGNVRFMPEVLYFVTELILASDSSTPQDVYGISAVPSYQSGGPYSSGLFLAKVVRPIYIAIFDEWYDRVEVDATDGRDVKKLREGFDTFLPPDVSNYDDWNEMFCNPERLAQGLVLDDGTPLFEHSHVQRCASLHRVDWAASLHAYATKTHREVHSLLGVFATTHRIWLLHAVLFFVGMMLQFENDKPAPAGDVLLQGNTPAVRFGAIGLLVPLHGILVSVARWHVSTPSVRRWNRTVRNVLVSFGFCVLWAMPLFTYGFVRYLESAGGNMPGVPTWVNTNSALVLHAGVSVLGVLSHLIIPGRRSDKLWSLTSVPCKQQAFRYCFWIAVLAVKFYMNLTIFKAVCELMDALDLVRLGQEPLEEIPNVWFSSIWAADVLEYLLLWVFCFFLFVADTGIWYQIGCTCLGVICITTRRNQFALERSVFKIPQRFSHKIFSFSNESGGQGGHSRSISSYFPMMWDRIMEQMRCEDKCDNKSWKGQSFNVRGSETQLESGGLTPSISGSLSNLPTLFHSEASTELGSDQGEIRVPDMFASNKSIVTIGAALKRGGVLSNAEMRWRLNSIARCLAMPMPRPFRAPYIPGITVLIPHLKEDILTVKKDLYSGKENGVPLIDWVKARYSDEFDSFISRMQDSAEWKDLPVAGNNWSEYSEKQWDAISMWASMRLQTLWRTVAGMSLYHAVLQCHYEAQADEQSALARADVWDPSDCFTCLVSMQLYNTFTATQLEHTNQMFNSFPDSLKVAYLDNTEKNVAAESDGVHERQGRRYFSCLIDKSCSFVSPAADDESTASLCRTPKFRIELPGFPILGDGKSDNQNHAMPFMRGAFAQCIDSNQGAYFEQMMLLPCVLGEFRTKQRGGGEAKRIIGLPEHITSDFGSVGDFAAGAELAFGTVLQRSHAVLGARMHYGHPDIMNKQYMIQQGGVSKATKTLNLSEDIFAGMDFMLRGSGRNIKHCEYFYLTKGRDLGFNGVMGFCSKISSGTGEQLLTRQMFRLSQILPLPDALSFYYAHAGFYITQAFMSLSMPVTVSTWLLVLVAGCEGSFQAYMNCPTATTGDAMSVVLSAWCSWVLVFFLFAQAMPLFMQMWMEMGLRTAFRRLITQWITGSWCFFIFQAKLVGHYVVNEIRYGGAAYVATGRGLPTQRRPFIGTLDRTTGQMKDIGGLYLDYAALTYYDAVKLLLSASLVLVVDSHAGGFAWTFVGLTIFSWLYAPFLFNPYQFSRRYFAEDLRSWWAFFFGASSIHWIQWYDRTQLQPKRGFRHAVWDIKFLLGFGIFAVWFSVVYQKVALFSSVYSVGFGEHMEGFSESVQRVFVVAPPIALSAAFCFVVALFEMGTSAVSACCRGLRGHAEGDRGFQRHGCHLPLPLVALVVVVAEIGEAAFPLCALEQHGWRRTFVGGLVLKLLLTSLALFLAEGVLSRKYFKALGAFGRPLELFVQANRLARDLAVSALIFWTLAIGVLLNSLNEVVCPKYNLHQLFIYRSCPLQTAK
mmetsp:Transcript_10441/g.36655  ORF Transcript_10441/g.36655 Transcript_10441/m.36655 type:complete len:1882 (-) Transcript_10441:161-5806(-)